MNVLEIIGLFTVCVMGLILLYKVYRWIFGYSWNSCPNDHDTMARQGVLRCDKCNSDL